MPIRSITLLFPVIVGCLISSCSLTPNRIPPVLEAVTELPDEFAESEVAGSYEPLEWWKAFTDPVLDQVIEAVLASNFDLAEATVAYLAADLRPQVRAQVRTYRVGHAHTACFVAPGDDFLAQPRLLDQFLSQNGLAACDEIPPLGERWQLIHAILC